MAHLGEKTNGTHYARGFKKLRTAKSEEDLKAEQALRDFESGKYGPNAPETKPEKPPKPVPPPRPDPYEGLSEEEKAELKRRERVRKATGGR